jgi:putative component of membrane protein insertase Oxa1/YidC/SpoIIIJ protein YidD
MKGPAAGPRPGSAVERTPEASSIRLVFLGAIELFQKRISPIEGPRCGFIPSCSAFGHQAVREQGPILGVMMTADRLMRDTILTVPGPGYIVLPNGVIFDPVSRNLLRE